jgi:hypothetical protein
MTCTIVHEELEKFPSPMNYVTLSRQLLGHLDRSLISYPEGLFIQLKKVSESNQQWIDEISAWSAEWAVWLSSAYVLYGWK